MAPERPVLWEGPFECACGFRADAQVLGRRGHRYDELEAPERDAGANAEGGQDARGDEGSGEEHIREDYSGEARSVLDLAPCPSCKRRRQAGRELKRQLLYLVVLLAMSAATVLVLWRTNEALAAKAAAVAAVIALAARVVVFALAWFEAAERVRFTPR